MRRLVAMMVMVTSVPAAYAYRRPPPPPEEIRRLEAPKDGKADTATILTGSEWIYLNPDPDQKQAKWKTRFYTFTADGTALVTTNYTAGPEATSETWTAKTAKGVTVVTIGTRGFTLGPCIGRNVGSVTATVCLTPKSP